MNFEETILSTEAIYEGRVVNLFVDQVRLPNGRTSTREVIRHGGAVALVPLHQDGQITLVRQYRLPTAGTLLEIPAGTLEPGEDPLDCAARELQEEVGLLPGRLIPLGGIFLAPGYSSEYIHLYLALDLTASKLVGDEDEFLEVLTMPFEQVLAMIDNGEINDAKTITALFKAMRWLAKHKK